MKSAANFDHKELNKLRLVFEQTPGAIFILDREFRFEYVNPGYEKLSGFSKSELLGKSVGEIFSQTDYTEPRKEIIQSMLAGEKWEGEMQTYKKDGSTYWATTVSSPFWEDDGTLEGYIIIQQDVTDRKVIEQSLRESENLYRSLIENSMNAVALNQDEKFILVNSAFCKTMGYSHEEIFSMNPASIIAPHDFNRVMNIHRRRMEGEFESINYTAQFVHKTGRLILAELNATTIQLNGRNASYVSLRDITQKNRLEQELKKSEQKYRELTEMLPIGVYELDLQGQIQYINQAGKKLFNFDSRLDSTASAMSLFTKSDSDFMTQNLKNEIERLRSLNFETEQEEVPIPVEFTAKRANGEEFQVLVYLNYILDDGKVTGFRGIIIDISERKAIENALRESEEKYKTLVENSHDGIIIVRHGKVLYANDTICNMLDHCLEGKMLLSENIVHPEDQNKMLEIAEKRKNGDISTINIIVRLIAKDGSVKVCYTTSTMIKFEGEWAAFYTVHDTTEKNRIQYELIESEKKYRQLTEMLPLTVYELDANNKPTYINKAGRELFGLNSKNSGRKAMSFFVPGDRERMKDVLKNENYNAQNLAHNANPNPSDPAEYTVQKPDGTNIPVLIYGTAIVENGKPVGSRGVILDISERKAMENALRDSEEKYRTLIENATDGIVIVQNGLLKFANQTMCDIMKYSMEELINKPFLDYIDVTEHESLNQFHLRRMQGEQFSNILRSQFIRKDGKMITVELNARTSNYNGAPAGFIVIRDITDRLKIETELQYAKTELEKLNSQLEKRVKESSKRLTEARTQLINLQKENLQSQYDVLKQQVNPHFLFNSLNVLTSLIKLEPDLAEKFSEQLSKVYRYVLENKDNELVDLNTELNFLDAYIFLLNIRFVGKLILNLHIPIENRSDKIIPLAMQLLIENAIKHNVMSKSTPLIIDIFIDESNCLNVINNLQERPSQIVSTGVGLKNILNRYKLLNLTAPIFEKTDTQFKAKIQLVKN